MEWRCGLSKALIRTTLGHQFSPHPQSVRGSGRLTARISVGQVFFCEGTGVLEITRTVLWYCQQLLRRHPFIFYSNQGVKSRPSMSMTASRDASSSKSSTKEVHLGGLHSKTSFISCGIMWNIRRYQGRYYSHWHGPSNRPLLTTATSIVGTTIMVHI